MLSWARETFGIKLNVSGSILSVPQPEETKKIVEKVLETLDKWEMAGKKPVLQAASDQL